MILLIIFDHLNFQRTSIHSTCEMEWIYLLHFQQNDMILIVYNPTIFGTDYTKKVDWFSENSSQKSEKKNEIGNIEPYNPYKSEN